MLSKKEIKDIQSLGHKKFRNETKLFIAEGPKIVSEFLELIPGQIERIYATEEWKNSHGNSSNTDKIIVIPEKELERISQLQTPNQVLAVVKQFQCKTINASTFTIYLDAIQDPGNFGTIIRIADWFGVKNIVCSEGCAEMYNPKVVQSTMASIARVNIFYDEKNDWLQQQNVSVYAATLNGTSIYEHEKIDKGILIIGNESKGISNELLQLATQKITIP